MYCGWISTSFQFLVSLLDVFNKKRFNAKWLFYENEELYKVSVSKYTRCGVEQISRSWEIRESMNNALLNIDQRIFFCRFFLRSIGNVKHKWRKILNMNEEYGKMSWVWMLCWEKNDGMGQGWGWKYTKINSNELKMNVRPKTTKLLKENIGCHSLALVLAMMFFDLTPEAKAQKWK